MNRLSHAPMMRTTHDRTGTLLRLGGGVAALTLAALAATAPYGHAGEPATPHNEQVALVNGSDAQPEQTKSDINGTAQVVSATGEYVVFSTAAALVPWDRNGTDDVYLRSRADGVTVLVSGRGRRAGNDASFEPTISSDGRYVAYTTWSTNLAKGTRKGALDVVVHDMHGSRTVLASTSASGVRGKGNAFSPVISGNGRHVAFQTFLALGRRDKDRHEDVYVRDLRRGVTRQVSLRPRSNRDVAGPLLVGDVSDNGRLITFGNSESLWVRDMAKGRTTRFHHEPRTAQCVPFEEMASAGRPVISGDGRYVAFSSCARALVGADARSEIFRMSLATKKIERLTYGDADSYLPSLSRNGRYLAFGSEASNLVSEDTEGQPDTFHLDTATGLIQRVSQGPDGAGGRQMSGTHAVAINGNGRAVAYHSYADNLVVGDESDYDEVFVWFG